MAYGYQRSMDNLGAAIGPLAASLILLLFPNNFRLVFGLSAIPGLLAVWYFVTKVKEEKIEMPRPARAPAAVGGSPLAGGIPKGSFRTFLLAMILFTLGNSSDMFLILRAQDTGITMAAIPILWMALSIVKAAAGTPGGALSDRIGRRLSILLGWFLYAAVYLGFGLATKAWQIWALFIVYGLYYGLTEGAERAMVVDLVPEGERGRAFGWYHLSIGIGAFPASVMFGLIWKFAGAPYAFGFGAIMAFVGAVWLMKVKRSDLAGR